jgi:hypothetical protein
MINKSSLQRIARIAGAILLAGSMVACGDDNPDDAVDAGTVDGPSQPPPDGGGNDACVGGHGGTCGVTSPFQLPEGGEFRLERFKLDENNTDNLAAHAFLFSGQEPPFRALGGPEIPIRQALADQGYSCADFSPGALFDNGYSEAAQAVADSREYFDVGGARLINAEQANDTIELQTSIGTTDPRGATDESGGLVHKILYKGDVGTDVSLFARYVPEIDGSAAYPSLDLKYGESVVGDEMADADGNGTPQIYMPGGFTMTSPAEADFYAPGSLKFTKGQDLTLTYTLNDPEPVGEDPATGGYPSITPFIGFVDDGGQVVAYCFKVNPGELDVLPGTTDEGEFIVPYEVLEFVPAAPTTGYVLFGRFTHVAWEVQREPITRLDLLGVECLFSQQWQVADAAP